MQRNLKLGGNTDKQVRPKLVIYQLRAFCFGEMPKRREESMTGKELGMMDEDFSGKEIAK